MKYFKCGKCHTPFKVDETALKSPVVSIACKTCSTKNTLRFGGFLIIQNKKETKQIPLLIGEFILGRKNSNNKENFLYIQDEFVSRNHCLVSIIQNNDKFSIKIEDLNSTNGTFNSKKVKIKTGIKHAFLKDDYFIVGLTKVALKFY
jgi:hypothetical protein